MTAVGELIEDWIVRMGRIRHAGPHCSELAGSGNERIGAGMGGEGHDLQALGVLTAHVERLAPDRAGAAENGDTLASSGHRIPPKTRSRCAVRQPKMSESERSSIPP